MDGIVCTSRHADSALATRPSSNPPVSNALKHIETPVTPFRGLAQTMQLLSVVTRDPSSGELKLRLHPLCHRSRRHLFSSLSCPCRGRPSTTSSSSTSRPPHPGSFLRQLQTRLQRQTLCDVGDHDRFDLSSFALITHFSRLVSVVVTPCLIPLRTRCRCSV